MALISERMELPHEGIYDSKGCLFHHRLATNLKEVHYERLEQHGINVRARSKFTPEETLLIMKNWKRYADKHDIPINNALSYMSVDTGIGDRENRDHRRDHLFYPELCRGMPYRTANQIRSRAATILEPNFLKSLDWENDDEIREKIKLRFYSPVKLTDDMKQKIKEKLLEGKSLSGISQETGVRLSTIRGIRDISAKWKKSDSKHKFASLWDACAKSGLDEETFRDALYSMKINELNDFKKDIDWKDVSKLLVLDVDDSKNLWSKFEKYMASNFKKSVKEGKTKEEAYETLIKLYIKKPRLTLEQQLDTLEIICSIINHGYGSETQPFDKKELKEKMIERGITNFDSGQYTEVDCAVIRLSFGLSRFNVLLFRNLRSDFEWKFKYHILLWALKRIYVWSKVKGTNEQSRAEIVLENEKKNPYMSKWTKKFLRNTQVKKWLEDDEYGNVAVKNLTVIYGIEAFVLYCHRCFKDEFVFPTTLHELIYSSSVKEILCEEENDDEYITIKDTIAVIEENVNPDDFCKNNIPVNSIFREKVGERNARELSVGKENKKDDGEKSSKLLAMETRKKELKIEKERIEKMKVIYDRKKKETAEERKARRYLQHSLKRKERVAKRRLENPPKVSSKYKSVEFLPTSDDSDTESDADVRRGSNRSDTGSERDIRRDSNTSDTDDVISEEPPRSKKKTKKLETKKNEADEINNQPCSSEENDIEEELEKEVNAGEEVPVVQNSKKDKNHQKSSKNQSPSNSVECNDDDTPVKKKNKLNKKASPKEKSVRKSQLEAEIKIDEWDAENGWDIEPPKKKKRRRS